MASSMKVRARIVDGSALAPSASCRASMRMDLPAPVSPVSTLKPQSKQISACSITAIFSMCSTFSIIDPSVKEQCAEAALSV